MITIYNEKIGILAEVSNIHIVKGTKGNKEAVYRLTTVIPVVAKYVNETVPDEKNTKGLVEYGNAYPKEIVLAEFCTWKEALDELAKIHEDVTAGVLCYDIH